MKETKPFKISKQAVKIAFERVKANRECNGRFVPHGSYGIDGRCI